VPVRTQLPTLFRDPAAVRHLAERPDVFWASTIEQL